MKIKADTFVLSNLGFKQVKDLVAGDYLVNTQDTANRVKRIGLCQNKRHMPNFYRIEPFFSNSFWLSDEFTVKRKDNKFIYLDMLKEDKDLIKLATLPGGYNKDLSRGEGYVLGLLLFNTSFDSKGNILVRVNKKAVPKEIEQDYLEKEHKNCFRLKAKETIKFLTYSQETFELIFKQSKSVQRSFCTAFIEAFKYRDKRQRVIIKPLENIYSLNLLCLSTRSRVFVHNKNELLYVKKIEPDLAKSYFSSINISKPIKYAEREVFYNLELEYNPSQLVFNNIIVKIDE